MSEAVPPDILVGIDTHKHVHAAVAITALGARLGELSFPVGPKGYRQLAAWAGSLGKVRAFGIEGTGSYGAGVSRFLRGEGHTVLEVSPPDESMQPCGVWTGSGRIPAHGGGGGRCRSWCGG